MKLHEASELTSSVGETGLKDESCEQGEPQHEQPRRAKETPCNRADRSNEPQAPRQSRKSSQDERQKGETSQTNETSKRYNGVRSTEFFSHLSCNHILKQVGWIPKEA